MDYGCVPDLLSLDAFLSLVGLCVTVRVTVVCAGNSHLSKSWGSSPRLEFQVVTDGSAPRKAGTECCQWAVDSGC